MFRESAVIGTLDFEASTAYSQIYQSCIIMSPAAMNIKEVRAVWTSEKGSMAKQTAESRWPKIIQGTIDDLGKTAAAEDVDEQKRAEGTAIQIVLKGIKTGIEQDKPLTYVLLQQPKTQGLTARQTTSRRRQTRYSRMEQAAGCNWGVQLDKLPLALWRVLHVPVRPSLQRSDH